MTLQKLLLAVGTFVSCVKVMVRLLSNAVVRLAYAVFNATNLPIIKTLVFGCWYVRAKIMH
jgi:hypothetical protein